MNSYTLFRFYTKGVYCKKSKMTFLWFWIKELSLTNKKYFSNPVSVAGTNMHGFYRGQGQKVVE